jgi:hypothetical protein
VRRIAVAALAALVLAAGTLQGANASPAGRWSISQARGDDQSRVQLRLEYSDTRDGGGYSNSSRSSPIALTDVGLAPDRLRGPIGPVTFRLQREPGSFDCTGSAGEGSGAGQFRYEPSAKFDDALASRGLGRPSFQQSLELAIAGATLSFVDQLRASAQHATVGDIVRVVQHGVNPRYIADLAALGYRTTSLDELVRLRDHGVTAEFIRAMQAAGYRDLSSGDLVRLADHGVTPRYIGDLAAAGYKNLGAEDLVALRDHGVSVAFVDRLKSHGYTNLSVRDLIKLRDSGI